MARRVGRPLLFTDERKEVFRQALIAGANVNQACSEAGVSRWTFQNHMALDSEFQDWVEMVIRGTRLERANARGDRLAMLRIARPEMYGRGTPSKRRVQNEKPKGKDQASPGKPKFELIFEFPTPKNVP